MNVRIVDVSLSDVNKLQEISRRTFVQAFAEANTPENMALFLEQYYAEDKLRGEVMNTGSRFLFGLQDDEVIGYLKVNTGEAQTVLPNPGGLEIERIYVDRAFKKNGLGSLFINKALETAIQNGSEYVWLGVWEKNEPAIQFYKKHGFVVFGQHVFLLGDDPQNDLLMSRKVIG